ncbi:MAG: hypothetical protein K0R73_1394 [Candidatus Midichloriaceae bacterium]|jgi:hypothetical protein|nr:hypothetical protein [Candidatus Midichloriaceae bacterium]
MPAFSKFLDKYPNYLDVNARKKLYDIAQSYGNSRLEKYKPTRNTLTSEDFEHIFESYLESTISSSSDIVSR